MVVHIRGRVKEPVCQVSVCCIQNREEKKRGASKALSFRRSDWEIFFNGCTKISPRCSLASLGTTLVEMTKCGVSLSPPPRLPIGDWAVRQAGETGAIGVDEVDLVIPVAEGGEGDPVPVR